MNHGKLDKRDDKMEGNLNMNNHKIIGLNTDYPPQNDTQAVCWKTVSRVIGGVLSKTGDTMLGNLNMNTYKIINLDTEVPTFDHQAVCLSQVKKNSITKGRWSIDWKSTFVYRNKR